MGKHTEIMPDECIADHLFEAVKQSFGDQKFNDIREFTTIVTQYTARTSIKMELGSSSCKVINVCHVLETAGMNFKYYEQIYASSKFFVSDSGCDTQILL